MGRVLITNKIKKERCKMKQEKKDFVIKLVEFELN